MDVRRIGVVGCGQMGAGIAEVSAHAGGEVAVVESDHAALEAGQQRVERSLANTVNRGKLDEDEATAVLGRLEFVDDLAALADHDLVIEAVTEVEQIKVDLFRALDAVVTGDHTILASNTSSIPIMKLAMATGRPEQVIGLHFFNPVPVLPLVELVPSLLTSESTVSIVERFAVDALHKHIIRSQDRAGFIVNALLVPYILSAVRMLESGFASAEDIDLGMVQGCAHPMGPLALADLIGLDTTAAIADSLYAEFKEQLYSAPPLLMRMVDAGLLGRKTGRGFYTYDR